MGYYTVLSAPRGGKRHISGVDGNTCPTVKHRAHWSFWDMGSHRSLRDVADWTLRPTCRYCVTAVERAVTNGAE